MRTIAIRVAAVMLALAAFGAAAQGDRVDVTLSHTGSDAAGKRLAAALASDVAGNKRLNLVKKSDQRIGIYLATMKRGDTTVYSATWTLGGMADDGYLTSKVGVCDEEAVRACARTLLAETAKHASVLWSVRAQQARLR